MAENILNRSVMSLHGARIPNPEDEYYSLLYHAVYHKGFKCTTYRSKYSESSMIEISGKFYESLKRMALKIGVDFMPSLEHSEIQLASTGWRPPKDMLNHFALSNDWLKSYLSRRENNVKEGFSVFILRSIVEEWNIAEDVVSMIESEGFKIIDVWTIPVESRDEVASKVRGGNWSSGNAWSVNGGLPAIIISAFDDEPIKPSVKQIKASPSLKNSRILVKKKMRSLFTMHMPEHQRANFIHTADNSIEAFDYADIILPTEKIDFINNYFASINYPHQIVKDGVQNSAADAVGRAAPRLTISP